MSFKQEKAATVFQREYFKNNVFDIKELDIERMTEQQLLEERTDIQTEMFEIKTQLAKANVIHKTTGKFADPEWWHKANTALRLKGINIQRIQEKLSKLKAAKCFKSDNKSSKYGELSKDDWDSFYKVIRYVQKINEAEKGEA